ncbi:hypothetical protein H5410_061531 [Solanum commersonii]|uniref:Uncharacterized protein n=1 Tax=Solanum commersonii TaxID=4109 RepID=A0A9J5W838_SOLCO|nr:hypothetical protein H5410_061531 [Solanum commersonii]
MRSISCSKWSRRTIVKRRVAPRRRSINCSNWSRRITIKRCYYSNATCRRTSTGEGESTTPHHYKGPILDEVVIFRELLVEGLPQGEGASAAPNHQEEPLLKGAILDEVVIAINFPADELPQGEGASSATNFREDPLLKWVVFQRPPFEELSIGKGESSTPYPSQRTTLNDVVIAYELPSQELPHGEGASAVPNGKEEPLLIGVVLQRPPIEELSTREQESVNLHHFQGQTLDELVTAKELLGEELPQGEGASTTLTDQEEPLLKGVIIQLPPLEELSTGEGESTTPYHSKGPILDEVVIAKELHAEELPQGE